MNRLRDGTAELLIATDVAARGLDVDTLTHVVNYDVPSAPDSYVHRIGRVGRAGREGVAITLAEPREQRLLAQHRAAHQAADQHRDRARPSPISAAGGSRRRPSRSREALGRDDRPRRPRGESSTTSRPSTICVTSRWLRSARPRSAAPTRPTISRSPTPASTTGREAGQGSSPRPQAAARPERRLVRRTSPGQRPTDRLPLRRARPVGRHATRRPRRCDRERGRAPGRQIGPIRIADQYSVVGVPERSVDQAIGVLNGSTIRGQGHQGPSLRRSGWRPQRRAGDDRRVRRGDGKDRGDRKPHRKGPRRDDR